VYPLYTVPDAVIKGWPQTSFNHLRRSQSSKS